MKAAQNFKKIDSWTISFEGYSCALMSDILLQGHLYVTENYIAFHSNVFGYVTRVNTIIIIKLYLKAVAAMQLLFQSKLSSESSQSRFSDPDPDDLDHGVHEGEDGEDNSERGGRLHPRGHPHLHLLHIKRGNL